MEKLKKIIRKNKTPVIISTVIILLLIISTVVLNSNGELVEESPYKTINEDKSTVYMTGKDYAFNAEQEKEYTEEKKRKEDKRAEEKSHEAESVKIKKQYDETGIKDHLIANTKGPDTEKSTNTGTGGGGQGHNGKGDNFDENQKKPDITRSPSIKCTLENNMNISGEYVTFNVWSKDYKGRIINPFYIETSINGEKIYSSGTDNDTGKITYRNTTPLNNGVNEVTISVKDSEGNTAEKTYFINADASGQRKEGGIISIKLELETLGLGVFLQDNAFTFYEGESVPYIVDRFLKENGIKYEYTGTFAYGFYLSKIYYPGITDNYKIPDKLYKWVTEENISETGYDRDSLGQKDFYEGSGFCYMINGELQNGMSTVTVNEGDDIHIGFTLNLIQEYDGTRFNYGEW